jgi:hypothetical protein
MMGRRLLTEGEHRGYAVLCDAASTGVSVGLWEDLQIAAAYVPPAEWLSTTMLLSRGGVHG